MMHSGNIAIVLLLAVTSPALAVDWMFAPSTYTHDPQTAQRVTQYAEPKPVYSYQPPSYQRSGYRHNTSINRVGANADRLHIVEEWGRPVRPYGEWRFPYRPYSVPYDAWGPPFGGLGRGNLGFGGFGPGGLGPGAGNGFPRPWLGPYANPPGARGGRVPPGASNMPGQRQRFDDAADGPRRFDDDRRTRSEPGRSVDESHGRILQGAT